jgi:hypothetical protein
MGPHNLGGSEARPKGGAKDEEKRKVTNSHDATYACCKVKRRTIGLGDGSYPVG